MACRGHFQDFRLHGQLETSFSNRCEICFTYGLFPSTRLHVIEDGDKTSTYRTNSTSTAVVSPLSARSNHILTTVGAAQESLMLPNVCNQIHPVISYILLAIIKSPLSLKLWTSYNNYDWEQSYYTATLLPTPL
jgi:hypothetical protein